MQVAGKRRIGQAYGDAIVSAVEQIRRSLLHLDNYNTGG